MATVMAKVMGEQSGAMEWIVLRNATRERAFGIVPILAHPVSGTDDERHAYDYAILASNQPLASARLARLSHELFFEDWLGVPANERAFPIALDSDEAMVTAFKAAHEGDGVIARIQRLSKQLEQVELRSLGLSFKRAMLCDARERDLCALSVVDGKVNVPLHRAITSIRLLLG
jgi:hypothetical protein